MSMRKDKIILQTGDRNRIMDAAVFHESKGMTQPISNMRSLHHRAVEFTRYVERGSMTVDQLEGKVYLNRNINFNQAPGRIVRDSAPTPTNRSPNRDPDKITFLDIYKFLKAIEDIEKAEDEKENQN